jgi:hypothetical protein
LRRKGRVILLKDHSPKMMERISNCPNNRQEIKDLISDFRDVVEGLSLWEEAFVLIHGRIIHPRGDE